MGANIIRFSPNYSVGLGASASIDDEDDNSTYDVSIFGGPRFLIHSATYFVVGFGVSSEFGEKDHRDIEASYSLEPYVGIDYYFSTHVLTSAFISSYGYRYERLDGKASTNTNEIFSSGGIGISYLF